MFEYYSNKKLLDTCLSNSSNLHKVGAGRGNRTLITRSEAWDSAIKLYPQKLYILYYTKLFFSTCFFQKNNTNYPLI